MKKVLLVLAIAFSGSITPISAQSGFIITDSVELALGIEQDSVYVESRFHMANLLSTGQVPCDLSTWLSLRHKLNGFARTSPRVDGVDINTATITIHPTDVIYISPAGDTVRFQAAIDFAYTKLQAHLDSLYNWNTER